MESPLLIRLLDVVSIASIEEAYGVSPRSIIINGSDFRSVEQVLMHSIVSPDFVVVSDRQIIAEVPEALRLATISDVMVLSQNLTLTDRSLVEFTVGSRPAKATGTVRLMQNFLRILLRRPASNLFHPRGGGGLLSRVGKNFTNAAADVQIAVQATKQYIIAVQTPIREIPPSERLLEAEITALDADPTSASLALTVQLTSHSGQLAAATLLA